MPLSNFEQQPIYDSSFVGRSKEIEWLRDRIMGRRYSHSPVFVTGMGGVGKTALVKHFLATSRISARPYSIRLYGKSENGDELDRFIEELYLEIPRTPFVLVVDEADALTEGRLKQIIDRIYNIKATRGVIFVSRYAGLAQEGEHLALEPLMTADSLQLLQPMLDQGLTEEQLQRIATVTTSGHPLAISILMSMLREASPTAYEDLIAGRVYGLGSGISMPNTEIITTIRPTIRSATEKLLDALKRQPASIYDIEPRQFEELLAHLLDDMGWEVELTPPSKDGGKDILAYLDTDVGKMLCLVEAKRYRADRKVGVDLVRTLYGTLCDHKASSAMLVTTSSFTAGAQEFQQRNKYQLALRDYHNVVHWIRNYGQAEA